MAFELIHKPTFTNQLLMIPREQMVQVIKKIELLREDPAPHGTQKKKLHGYKGDVYRLRSGNYRIVYAFGDGWVTLLGVDDRKDVYKGDRLVADEPTIDIHSLPQSENLLTIEEKPLIPPTPTHYAVENPLPMKLNADFLQRLRVSEAYFDTLSNCLTYDDLIEVDIPETLRNRIFDCLTTPNYDEVLHEPDYLTGDSNNLLRYNEGDLLGFLLRLSPEQEKYTRWSLDNEAPTLVKGGPGTGKSTVALYRVRTTVCTLRESGIETPKVLYTTYTNALCSFSRQLLSTLLGEDTRFVEVQTADSIAYQQVSSAGLNFRFASVADLHRIMRKATYLVQGFKSLPGNKTIIPNNVGYLLDEILGVIIARQLGTIEEYQMASRVGRKIPLSAAQRSVIWQLCETFQRLLEEENLSTWQQLRARAETIVRTSVDLPLYDAVIIDEAQDLDPSALRMLVELCANPKGLFITADANQSIYGSGFRWDDVHEWLQFRGHTGMLRTNYRSTAEISTAANSYLHDGAIDSRSDNGEYLHTGPLPIIRRVNMRDDETELLAHFFREATHELRLGLNSCAIFSPSEKAGQALAERLKTVGIKATFMSGHDLNLALPCVKILTMKSAKGLEFPIVALAGFLDGIYPVIAEDLPAEERNDKLAQERRTLYVGMTRAMRALLVVLRKGAPSPLFQGVDANYWNLE